MATTGFSDLTELLLALTTPPITKDAERTGFQLTTLQVRVATLLSEDRSLSAFWRDLLVKYVQSLPPEKQDALLVLLCAYPHAA